MYVYSSSPSLSLSLSHTHTDGISSSDVEAVYTNVKRSDYITFDNSPADPEVNRIDYSEFCQALVMVALYRSVVRVCQLQLHV